MHIEKPRYLSGWGGICLSWLGPKKGLEIATGKLREGNGGQWHWATNKGYIKKKMYDVVEWYTI